MVTPSSLFSPLLLASIFATVACLPVPVIAFQHAEARLVHPLELSADGTQLLAVDSVNARLSVFDVTGEGPPVLVKQIPTGLEPVSVRRRTADEVWVVNELGDSISVISLSQGRVVRTLPASDEPADVVFAQGKAFVTCARSHGVRVFDTQTYLETAILPLKGLYPRALSVSADEGKVYAAFFESGNRTTILPKEKAPAQPAPTNPALPPPPKTALIVPADDPRVDYVTLDHDVVGIDVATLTVTGYATGVGTNLFAMAIHPSTGDLWVGSTEAFNLIRHEPALRGKFAANRLSRVEAGTGTVTNFDLNAGLNYDILPNPAAQSTALAQPAALCFTDDGSSMWVAAFSSDRIARINPVTAEVVSRVDIRTGLDVSAAAMRGPRGLALDATGARLFVHNKLSHTITVIGTEEVEVLHEVAISPVNPMPARLKTGRGHLFDARLSGNGTVSCGTCHFDADRDGLAWDLGDPGGDMMTVLGANLSIHDTTPRPRVMHPMKGPMVTQTLRGMQDGAPFHWRGDRAGIEDFNPTFQALMGGEEIGSEEMAALRDYLFSLVLHPNPNRNRDRSLPVSFADGNPVTGRDLYNNHVKSHCAVCHVLPKGSDNNIDLPQEVGSTQPLKTPPLRTVYQRLFFNPKAGQESLSGFGMLHDGTGHVMPIVHPYVLDDLNLDELRHVTAFMHCFDTGVAQTVGHSVTVTSANRGDASVTTTVALLEARARERDCDLVVRGLAGGLARNYLYNTASQNYRTETASVSLSRAALLALLQTGDSLTFMGTLPGSGLRLSVDEDEDGFFNNEDPNPGLKDGPPRILADLTDRAAAPGGSVTFQIQVEGLDLTYAWYKGSQLLPTVTGPVLSLNPVSSSDAGSYSVRIQNGAGSVNSRAAALAVYAAPVITAHPQTVGVKEGQKATFTVNATGEKLTYQWRRGSSPVGGATARVLTLNEVSAADIGSYHVIVSNGAGSATSQTAALEVVLKPVVAPLNLPDAIVGQDYEAQLTAANQPVRFNVSGLPAGLKCDAASGRITGRPKTAKVYTVKASATNAAGTGQTVTQDVAVEAFPQELIGAYEGVLPPDEDLNGNLGGRLRLSLSKTGTLSGKLDYGAASYAFKGVVEISPHEDPVAVLTVNRPKAEALELHLNFHRASRSVGVRIGPEQGGQRFTAWLPAANADALNGGYTWVLSGSGLPENAPAGHGHGAFKNAKGKARGALVLADGSKVALSGTVGEGGHLIFRTVLYRRTGVVQGIFRLSEGEVQPLEASEVVWFKQRQATSTRSYPEGFGPLSPAVLGGWYDIPADGMALELPAGSGNARLRFEEGGLLDPQSRTDLLSFEIQGGNPAKILYPEGGNPGKVKLTVIPGKGNSFNASNTGLLKGSFELSDAGPNGRSVKRKAAFSGRIVRDGGRLKGLGFFLLDELPTEGGGKPLPLSGRVVLEGTAP